ncbi:MAG: hypothetical protein ACTH2Y_07180 [Corynebacterium sp.]|uniref:hypothetical protein n=1 Tax=unclassified Corynebacterium TaxID=2624378 RepID=UPI0026498711|nr:hypothetical protein [Corynebacterium sp.]MDN5583038.1 hypothetical protein [Corynebacterium sp.]MDN5719937.1 hypothetical protein [Corynebacterium sp.]MDN6259418.1 hypothetical protein [Corynebacterium sp.]MDN6325966.1 hypothetical protein [Corynebacterium sp.]MDN6387477.1 hypothetical protein [Corynebacterium sp.]
MGPALFGQGLNFLAMLLPIIGQETGQLAYLMLPLALATVLSRTSILGFHSRYLTVSTGSRDAATSLSLLSMLVVTVVLVVVGLVADLVFTPDTHTVAVLTGWSTMLLLTNGLYVMAVAVATQEQRMDVYSTARLVFGVTNVVATCVVVFAVPFQAGLIVVAGLNPLVAAVLILWRTRNKLLNVLWRDRGSLTDEVHRRWLRDSTRPTGGVLLAEFGFQFQGFITPFLGPYQELWAVVVRLTGGFGTLAQQVVAPPVEAKIAAAVRADDVAGERSWCRKALLIGLALGAASAAVQAGAVLFSLHGDDSVTVLSLALVSVFCLTWMPSAMCSKIPLMKRLNRYYLAWAFGRLVLLLPLLLLRDTALLVGVVSVMSATAVFLMWTSLRPAQPE